MIGAPFLDASCEGAIHGIATLERISAISQQLLLSATFAAISI
jgi:hypothetical protein